MDEIKETKSISLVWFTKPKTRLLYDIIGFYEPMSITTSVIIALSGSLQKPNPDQ